MGYRYRAPKDSVLMAIPFAMPKPSQSSAEGSGLETLDCASEEERSRIAQRANSLEFCPTLYQEKVLACLEGLVQSGHESEEGADLYGL